MFKSKNAEIKKPEKLDPKNRSTRALDVAAVGSLAFGLVEAGFGIVANSPTLMANSVGMMDNSTLALYSYAARREHNRRTNHMVRRIAGAAICAASLWVAADAIHDLATDQMSNVETSDIGFGVVATAMNAGFVLGLRKNADPGSTHRDAWRHAAADTGTSGFATIMIAVGANGHPVMDAAAGIAMSAITIAATFPTNSRITEADKAFVLTTSIDEFIPHTAV